MTIDEYQEESHETASYIEGKSIEYLSLGLCSEAGEVAGKIKLVFRGDAILPEIMDDVLQEIGDTLWYLSELTNMLGHSLEYVAKLNLQKLKDRKERNKIHGSGDNR